MENAQMRNRSLAAIRTAAAVNPETLAFAIALQQSVKIEFDRNVRAAIRRAKQAQHARQLATSARVMNRGR